VAISLGANINNHLRPRFIISLDFELMWGVRDHAGIDSYGKHILGVRDAVPAMLKLFQNHQVRATWAAVGMLLFEDKKTLVEHFPALKPSYLNSRLNPYEALQHVGENEKEDPYHFGLSLARQIVESEGMELGSHSFCHYYCLESGQNSDQFSADLEASRMACARVTGKDPISFVFPRNQYRASYLRICKEHGFNVFRGNEKSWIYTKSQKKDSSLKRAIRLADSMINLTGDHVGLENMEGGLLNASASRFLRPYSKRLSRLGFLHCRRIMQSMTAAAKTGTNFHLWWHPHNFGMNLDENLSALKLILNHLDYCREHYGMESCNMGDLCQ